VRLYERLAELAGLDALMREPARPSERDHQDDEATERTTP
jgi:hypothetical protein